MSIINKPELTVGIPAYNEGANIGALLSSILGQKILSVDLVKIIVISDGSSDNTVQVVRSFKDERITIVDNKERMGVNVLQNNIVQIADSDILIMLNADILPINSEFIEKLAEPIIKNKKVGVVCAEMIPVKPRSFFEKVIVNSFLIKKRIFSAINNGNNLYNCTGVARAFSKSFYKTLNWPAGYPEDAYSYLSCIKTGFDFVYQSQAKILFRMPATFSDHVKQSTRFFGGQHKIHDLFDAGFAEKEYRIPLSILVKKGIPLFLASPLLSFIYLVIVGYIKLFSVKKYDAKWQIAESTKEEIKN